MNEPITLAGNPNVGKSTIFNALTGLRQHTGNWPGKTVAVSVGTFAYRGHQYTVTDLPGTYSFYAQSEDEQIAGDYIRTHAEDCTVIVCDATALERSLILALQTMAICPRTVLCINLTDEAKRKGICINVPLLEQRLRIPIVATHRKDRRKKEKLLRAVEQSKSLAACGEQFDDVFGFVARAEEICHGVITLRTDDPHRFDRRIDAILLGKYTALPCFFALLALLFYITLTLSAYPSALLGSAFDRLLAVIKDAPVWEALPAWIPSLLTDGVLTVVFQVVAVMLPPMAIFFPLFTLLEDFGVLPRIAFLLDAPFARCGTCGRQALTMCMGLGCNCTGITGCRIFSAPRERIIAVLTNAFTPCNGRFPMLLTVIALFFAKSRIMSVAVFLGLLVFSVAMTFGVSRLLSVTLCRDAPAPFWMELPPYRRPEIGKVLLRSIPDRTLFVLGRAISAAAPAGVLLWGLCHIRISGTALFAYLTDFFDPFGRLLGLDGTILTGFLLGLPANEIVIPIILMGYLSQSALPPELHMDALRGLLTANGWTAETAICILLFTLFHWPCATAILTIKKETASFKWTAVSVLLPTAVGCVVCFLVHLLFAVFG